LAKQVVIDNAMERFRMSQRSDAVDRLDAVFGTVEEPHPEFAASGQSQASDSPGAVPSASTPHEDLTPTLRQAIDSAKALAVKAERLLPDSNPEDAQELRTMLADLYAAIDRRAEDQIRNVTHEVEDLVFYLEDV
jgi:hypothetical protein